MNLTIESLNLWGARALAFVWPVLWQSSLLIGLLLALDFALRRKVRAAVRYALWLVVLLKLLLPPALALPTGPAWWLRPARPAPAAPPTTTFVINYGPEVAPALPEPVAVPVAPVRSTLSSAAWALGIASSVSLGLLLWMLLRWRQVTRDVRQAGAAPQALRDLLEEARRCVGLRRPVRLGLTERPMSPAVCGLFRPTILLPRSLAEQLTPAQLRAVLLHELIHLRRGDVWVNCAQALLQVAYWWHPLLWLANARIRQAREEAVDDAVMAALREEAETYAPTLLEVARLALQRPLTSLGLVGILESRNSLRQRIQRLLEFHPPRKAGLTLASALLVLAFAAVAVPMGEAPAPKEAQASATSGSTNSPVSGPLTNTVLVEQKHAAGLLVRDGMLLYQMGKLDEASAKLKEAVKLDPQNQAAYYYLNLVAEARYHKALSGKPRVRTSNGRQAILKKLNTLRLSDTALKAATLGDAVRLLAAQTKEHDPDKTGINFIIASSGTSSAAGASATNPPGMSTADLASVRLTLKPSSAPQKLADILDEVVKSAERPLKYSVEDYAIIFSDRQGRDVPALFTRTFEVEPNPFIQTVQTATGRITNTMPPSAVSEMVRRFIETKGVKIEPPKSVFFNDKEGRLYVRATQEDLEIIEEFLQQWMAVGKLPPQINLKAVFVRVPEAEAAAFRAHFPVTNAPGSETWSTVLPAAQAHGLLDQWYDSGAGHILGAPEVTTISERQCQCRMLPEATNLKVVLGDHYSFELVRGPHSTPTLVTNATPQTNALEVGSTIDMLPVLAPDRDTVQVIALANVTEFQGYAKAPESGAPYPTIRIEELQATNCIPDGQTLVLGGPVVEDATSKRKMHLLVFVTPTLIDLAGNRLHPNGESRPRARRL